VRDGFDLADAVELIEEANQRSYRFGLISLDAIGNMEVGSSSDVCVLHAKHDGTGISTFRDDA
jgi:hypothetical protein